MTSHSGIAPQKPLAGTRPRNTKAPAVMLPVFRLPLILYGLGLSRLMGTRFMRLTHVGRRTGRIRRTILAVLSFDAATKEIKTISAWGASDWYRNIQERPAVEVECGAIRYRPEHYELAPEEVASLFVSYRQKHPIFSNIVCRIPGWNANSSYEEFLQLARTLRGIAFRPAE